MRSWMLYRLRVNSSTLIVLASVSRKNSASWATQCISSLRMGCKRTAFSNSRRGNRVGSKMNGANLNVNERNEVKFNFIKSQQQTVLCTYLQRIIWKIGLWTHCCSMHQCPIFCFLNHIIQCCFIDWEFNARIQVWHFLVFYSLLFTIKSIKISKSNFQLRVIWLSNNTKIVFNIYLAIEHLIPRHTKCLQCKWIDRGTEIFLTTCCKTLYQWKWQFAWIFMPFFLPQSVYKYSVIVLSINVLVSIAKSDWQLWKAIFVTNDSMTFHATNRVAWTGYRSVAVTRISYMRCWNVLNVWIVPLRYNVIESH